jgi:hypothetical protein
MFLSPSDELEYNSDDYEFQQSSGSQQNSQNEFSRILHPDRIFPARRQHTQRQQQIRDYTVSITAKQEECQALADRFELTDLTQLQANLQLRPAISGFAGSSNLPVIEVEGSITSHLTQTCVRTNEKFEVDVEFPLYALVKPMSRDDVLTMPLDDDYGYNKDEDERSSKRNKKSKQNKKQNKAKFKASSKNVYSLQDVFDLQSALEANEAYLEDANDPSSAGSGAEASLIEDESIYSSTTGLLDVGELVAQTFWLQLDPFPKKPGTGPMEIEISG